MRISDWSSDVCSSDLDVGGMNLGEAMPYSGKNLRILGQASEKRSPLAPDVPTFKEQGIDLVFASERGLVGPAGMPAEVTERLRGARSEEHTSELQSLMRISYAVFGLNKNKKRKETIKDNQKQ